MLREMKPRRPWWPRLAHPRRNPTFQMLLRSSPGAAAQLLGAADHRLVGPGGQALAGVRGNQGPRHRAGDKAAVGKGRRLRIYRSRAGPCRMVSPCPPFPIMLSPCCRRCVSRSR